MKDMTIRDYRKYQSALMVAGQGTIMLCVWNVLKIAIYLTVDRAYFISVLSAVGTPDELMNLTTVMFVIVMCLIIFIRYKVGSAAMSAANCGQISWIYYLIIFLCLILSIFTILDGTTTGDEIRDGFERVATIVLEIFSDFLYITIIVSSIMIRKYRKDR